MLFGGSCVLRGIRVNKRVHLVTVRVTDRASRTAARTAASRPNATVRTADADTAISTAVRNMINKMVPLGATTRGTDDRKRAAEIKRPEYPPT